MIIAIGNPNKTKLYIFPKSRKRTEKIRAYSRLNPDHPV